jgi:predicted dinucleotide-binding enzyme
VKIAVVGKGSVGGGLANLWENPTPGNVWCGDEEARRGPFFYRMAPPDQF